MLTLFSLCSLAGQLQGICDKDMQSRALLAQNYCPFPQKKLVPGFKNPIFNLVLEGKHNCSFLPGFPQSTQSHTKKASPSYHFPLRQRQWLNTDTYLLILLIPDSMVYVCNPAGSTRDQAITSEVSPQYLLDVRSFQAAMFPFNNFSERE